MDVAAALNLIRADQRVDRKIILRPGCTHHIRETTVRPSADSLMERRRRRCVATAAPGRRDLWRAPLRSRGSHRSRAGTAAASSRGEPLASGVCRLAPSAARWWAGLPSRYGRQPIVHRSRVDPVAQNVTDCTKPLERLSAVRSERLRLKVGLSSAWRARTNSGRVAPRNDATCSRRSGAMIEP